MKWIFWLRNLAACTTKLILCAGKHESSSGKCAIMVIKEKGVIVRQESVSVRMMYHIWKGNKVWTVTILIRKRLKMNHHIMIRQQLVLDTFNYIFMLLFCSSMASNTILGSFTVICPQMFYPISIYNFQRTRLISKQILFTKGCLFIRKFSVFKFVILGKQEIYFL